MDTVTKICRAIDPTCVRLWKHDAISPVSDIEDRPHYLADMTEETITVKDTLILNADRCDMLYHKWAASDYMLSFYEYAYADMIKGMLTDHGRMVRATNKINQRIGKAPLQQKIEGPNSEF